MVGRSSESKPDDTGDVEQTPLYRECVHLPHHRYDVIIGTDCLNLVPQEWQRLGHWSRVVVVADKQAERYAARIVEYASHAGAVVECTTVPPGEISKSLAEAERLYDFLIAVGADRRTLLVAVGGGMVGDLAGFVAATYVRGISWIVVPTTLLAMVDSAVGGKVAINRPQAKNIVGAFHQPILVVADTDTLATLPDREYRSGLAEVVKYGLLGDRTLFERIEASVPALLGRQPDVLRQVIARSVALKARIVEADERELSHLREALNLGHTFAHALEADRGYREWLHGEAVAVGLVCALRLACRRGLIESALCQRLISLLQALHLPVRLPLGCDPGELLGLMRRDKKARAGRLRFVLPVAFGQVQVFDDVPDEDVLAVLHEALQ